MGEQITLRELMAALPTEIKGRVPGKVRLMTETSVVASYEKSGFRLTVYGSGYALAQQGKRWTVFPVCGCGAYEYEVDEVDRFEDALQSDFDAEYFMDLPWTIRLTMMAEDRLEQNNDELFSRLISKHPGYVENFDWLFGITPSAEHEVIQKMWWEEMLSSLSIKQKEVIELREAGYTETEVGGILGISRNAVSSHIKRSREKITKSKRITE